MIFSSNEHLLIHLLNYESFVSSNYLAEKLFVSTKTIYRIIKRINELSCEEYNRVLIKAEPGKGFKLATFFRTINIYSMIEGTEENSINDLALTLLFKYPKKVKRTILDKEFLSESSRERRLNKLQALFNKYTIKLRTDKEYIWLEGEERTIRKAINALFLEVNKINSLNEIGIKINTIDQFFIDRQITLIEETFHEYINYPYDITIYTHIYMLLKRYREGEVQYLDSQEPLEKDERQLMDSNEKMKALAEKVVRNLEGYLSLSMHPLEIYFLFQNIYSLNIQKRESSNVDKKLAAEITKKYIIDFFNITDVSLLPASRSLYEDLYQHVLPMLSRLRLGIKIENNLLAEVQLEYKATYLKVKKITNAINNELMFETKMNEAEIGYLTLYFEKYKIDRTEKKNLLLVCSTGIGTSELLKIRVQKSFPNLTVVATMSQRQAKKNHSFIIKNIDLIFSTIHFPFETDSIPVLNISPLLTENDIKNINYILKELEANGNH
ncbi:PRD domain-containing protein [Erwinia sp. CPCC 100877]|nr:PRD domain-containing protein [Erwinia sp. CPCC 100877]